jgi:hypothetical protein
MSRHMHGHCRAPVDGARTAHPHSDRLSILSNFSVQNLATPTSAIARDRPLLFEEPLSYSNQRRDSRDIADSPIGSERSYFIHRRVNADGDELVHNINLEWDDEDPLSWLTNSERSGSEIQDYAALPRRRFGSQTFDAHDTVRGPRGPPPPPEARRRGWGTLICPFTLRIPNPVCFQLVSTQMGTRFPLTKKKSWSGRVPSTGYGRSTRRALLPRP